MQLGRLNQGDRLAGGYFARLARRDLQPVGQQLQILSESEDLPQFFPKPLALATTAFIPIRRHIKLAGLDCVVHSGPGVRSGD